MSKCYYYEFDDIKPTVKIFFVISRVYSYKTNNMRLYYEPVTLNNDDFAIVLTYVIFAV